MACSCRPGQGLVQQPHLAGAAGRSMQTRLPVLAGTTYSFCSTVQAGSWTKEDEEEQRSSGHTRLPNASTWSDQAINSQPTWEAMACCILCFVARWLFSTLLNPMCQPTPSMVQISPTLRGGCLLPPKWSQRENRHTHTHTHRERERHTHTHTHTQ